MRRSHPVRRGLSLALAVVIAWTAVPWPAPVEAGSQRLPLTQGFKGKLPIQELSEEEAIGHALNRLGFGPRPGDVERVRAMGLEGWIKRQLQPETLDDSRVMARLERYPTLTMSASELLRAFPQPQPAARRPGQDPAERRRERERSAAGVRPSEMENERQGELQGERQGERQERKGETGTAPPAPGEQRELLRRRLLDGDPDRRMRLAELTGPRRVIGELAAAKFTRAIYSERQLHEVMVDFWFNHFNVFANKGADRWLVSSYERDAIRPQALGTFRDLLGATAKSPAMLFYLDNWLSADPQAAERLQNEMSQRRQNFRRRFGNNPAIRERLRQRDPSAAERQQSRPAGRRRSGLNENYARELMELHTLGVDGGYTQADVIQVARAFTGWTLRQPRRHPEFYFEARLHDPNPKVVLGKKIAAGGIKDGEAVLDLLARHPSTARFISTKLAERFVSDRPPESLIDRMAKTFRETGGDIRAVLRTMIYSPEFWAREAYRAKIKTPFELVASAARALGAEVNEPLPLAFWTARIGQPLYLCVTPNGYASQSAAWVNSGALLNRLNFGLALAGNRLPGARVNFSALVSEEAGSDPRKALAGFLQAFVGGDASEQTRRTLENKLDDPQIRRGAFDDSVGAADLGMIAGLVLGSPEFQRR